METSALSEFRPSTRNQAASPLMFESDEDSKDEEKSTGTSNKEIAEILAEPSKEEKILKGFQSVLMGIPPPPRFTVPQLDCREILKLWRDNHEYRVVFSPGKVKQDIHKQFEEEAKTTKWPAVTELTHWGIHYNRSNVSEELERLSMRYKERYVGAETASCVNVLYVKSPTRTASARKRMLQQAWGHSPGRRLSHLARRRKAFSSANLSSVAGNKNRDKKMIMVEIKKIGNRQTKKNSAKKTKPTPRKKTETEASTYKRALFQSPDQLTVIKNTQTPNTQRVQRSKRNLFANNSSEKKVNENGKRERSTMRRISPRKRVNRSLSFHDSQAASQESSAPPKTSSTQPPQASLILTGAHKQKMLWAATNALRDVGMGMNHELFRPCMTVLFKTCQKLWLTKVARQDKEGSTSENMLALTKQFSAFTIKEISVDPTSEHIVKVCNDIMRMAENTLKQTLGQTLLRTAPCELSCPKTVKEPDTSCSTECSRRPVVVSSDKLNLLNPQEQLNCKQTPLKITPELKCHLPKNSQCLIQDVGGSSAVSENLAKGSTPKVKNKLSQNNKLNAPGLTSPLTRSRKSAMAVIAKSNSVCNEKSIAPDMDHQSYKSKLNKSPKHSTKVDSMCKSESSLIDKSDNFLCCAQSQIIQPGNSPECPTKMSSRISLNQRSDSSERNNKSDDDFEKNKENLRIDRLMIDCSQKHESEKSSSSHKLLLSVENTPQAQLVPSESNNRTLQLYKQSNSGGEHVDTLSVGEPPQLMAHWEQEVQAEERSESHVSPPTLIPHWEHQDSGTTTSLPDSIMTHWQQMSANSVNTSDKIMFDFEDTSYEIVFPSANQDDTRASSVCAPFDYPHLADDSKSCFNSDFLTRSSSGNSNNSLFKSASLENH